MGKTKTNRWVATALVALAVIGVMYAGRSAEAATGINSQVSFQGKVVLANGTNPPDGVYNMQFKIYQDGNSSGVGSTLKWTESRLVSATQGVTVTAGTFQVNLGSVTAFSGIDWNQDTLWLSMNVGGTASSPTWDGEMSPYIRFTSVPYALNAGMVGGLTASQLVQLSPAAQQTGNVNVSGNITTGGNLYVGGTIRLASDGSLQNVKFGTTSGLLYTDVSGAVANLSVTGATSKCVSYNGTDIVWATCGSGGSSYNYLTESGTTLTYAGNAVINANSGFTGNLLDLKLDGTSKLSVNQDGDLVTTGTIVSSTNNTNAFKIQNASSEAVFNVDTTTKSINVGAVASYTSSGGYIYGTGFASKVDYTTGSAPYYNALADLDGDGDQDLAVANYSSSTVSILKNNGDGTFATKVDYATGTGAFPLTLADLDGDGDQDLAVANYTANTVSILKNNGDGTFATKVDYATSTHPYDITAADLDSDGDQDLAVANHGSNNVSILKNNGNATFATKVDYTTGTGPYGVTAADLDADGDQDLAVANNGSSNVSILKNNGNATFATKVDYAAGGVAYDVTAADLDADGDQDLAVANGSANTVSILKNNGNATFATKVDYTTGGSAQSVKAADLDGDGDQDLAVANGSANTVSVLKNYGDGAFATKVDYATGTNPYDIAIADLDGDTDKDLAIASVSLSKISVILNNYVVGGTPPTLTFSTASITASSTDKSALVVQAASGQARDILRVQGSDSASYLRVASDGNVTIGDATGTGTTLVLDSAASDPTGVVGAMYYNTTNDVFRCYIDSAWADCSSGGGGGSSYNYLTESGTTLTYAGNAVINAGSGFTGNLLDLQLNGASRLSVNQAGNTTVGGILTVTSNNVNGATITGGSLTATAVNGLTVSANSITAGTTNTALSLQGNGTGGINLNGATTVTGNMNISTGSQYQVNGTQISSANLSNDGNLAKLNAGQTFTGTNIFKTSTDSANGFRIQNAAGTDIFNVNTTNKSINIGAAATYTVGGGTLYGYDGNFSTKTDYGYLNTGIIFADLDGDGDQDMVGSNDDNPFGPIAVSENNGDGTFATEVTYGSTARANDVTVADLDGDGDQDIAFAAYNISAVSILKNYGDGTFNTKVDYTATASASSITAADLDADGDQDLAVTNSGSNTVSIFKNNGNATFATKVDYTTGAGPYTGVAIADLDADGDQDLAVANYSSNSVSILKNNGNATFATKVDYTTDTSPYGVDIADLDADGDQDLAVSNSVSNSVSILKNNGNATFATKVDYTTGTSPNGVAIADLDADGDQDLAVANYSSNSVSILKNNGNATFATKVDYTTGTGPYGVAISDLNGDGGLDLGVLNYSSYNASIFLNIQEVIGTSEIIVSATTSITSSSTDKSALILQGASAQTADILRVQGDDASVYLNVASNGNIGIGEVTDLADSDYALNVQGGTNIAGDVVLQNSDATDTLFAADTTNNRIVIGNATGTGADTTTLVLDSAASDPTGVVGAMYYNTTNDVFRCYIDSAWADCAGSGGGGGGGITGTGTAGKIAKFSSSTALADSGLSESSTTLTYSGNAVINAASGFTGNLLDLKLNGSSQLSVSHTGFITAAGIGAASAMTIQAGDAIFFDTSNAASAIMIGATYGVSKDIYIGGNTGATSVQLQSGSGGITLNGNVSLVGSSRFKLGTSASDITGTNGAMYYNTTNSVFRCFAGGAWADCAGSGGGGSSYNYLTESSTTLTYAGNAVIDADSGFTGNLLDLKLDGTSKFSVDESGSLTVGPALVQYTIPAVVAGNPSFNAKADYGTGGGAYNVTTADLDADGDQDLAITNYSSNTVSILKNNGNGTFATKVDYSVGSSPYIITSADLDADGDQDLAITNYSSNTVSILKNNGNGTFATKVDYTTGSGPDSIIAADLDADGDKDLAVANYSSNTVSILKNNGDATFATKVDYSTATNPDAVAAADFDADGDIDLATTNYSSDNVSILENNGSAVFAGSVNYTTADAPYSITAADLDLDGDVDIASASYSGASISVLKNNGNGTFATKVDYTTGTSPLGIVAADLNGDGYYDLATSNSGAAKMSVLKNNGDGTFATKVDYTTGASPYMIAAADFDDDGKNDLVVTNFGSNSVSVFINSTTFAAPPKVTSPALSVKTTASDGGGLYIQGSASQEAPLLVLQSYGGANLLTVDSTGSMLLNGQLRVDLTATATTNGICHSGTSSNTVADDRFLVVCSSTPNDYAEFYPTQSDVEAGDIVALTPNMLTYEASGADAETGIVHSMGEKQISILKKATIGDNAIGFVSTAPYQTIGKDIPKSAHRMPVALSGRVPVKVNNEGGAINAGDQISLSSVAGVATKAHTVGKTFGVALEPFNGDTGSIMVYVQSGYYELPQANLLQNSAITGQTLQILGDANIAGKLTVESLVTRKLTINGHIISGGNVPRIVVGNALGKLTNGAAVSAIGIDGTDSAGTVTMTSGDWQLATGTLAEISFAQSYGGSFKTVLTPTNEAATDLRVYIVKTSTGFTIMTRDIPTPGTQYQFDYIVIGTLPTN